MAGFMIDAAKFEARTLESGLYVVATPIGNLRDITIRALETLASVSLIACEDTRVSAKLLNRYAISVRMLAYHEHNAAEAGEKILGRIRAGESIALISDAGTPLISDPGQRLVAAARAEGLPVFPVPGPSAPVAALSASGLSCDAFLFAGFLPSKEKARRETLRHHANSSATLIFFESPNRLCKALADISREMGADREVVVAREITKLHEEFLRGTAAKLAADFAEDNAKGEIVLLIAPSKATKAIDPDALLEQLLGKMSLSHAVAEAAALTGQPRKLVYSRALEMAASRNRNGEK
jgi:16S rRNA (cytidine1402-2'-O)-methyltransferase